MDRKTICVELRRIRLKIHNGDESELWIWAIPGKLACAQRPLRDSPEYGGGPGRRPLPLPPQARPRVETWVDRIIEAGFRSVISLLEPKQLVRHYVSGGLSLHPDGLLGYYESRGLSVESIPCTDYQEPTREQKLQVLGAFRSLPGPVLLHCSAGIDRTSPVAAFLCEQERSS
jgi:hypothetical protein